MHTHALGSTIENPGKLSTSAASQVSHPPPLPLPLPPLSPTPTMSIEMAVELESHTRTSTTLRDTTSIFPNSQPPVTLKFEDVVYKIRARAGGGGTREEKTYERTILKGVSGFVLPGEMLVMLGPSGSGKTTLLTALGGRLGGALSGTVTYNGRPFSNSLKKNTGFVTQDDILYPHLTVTETLYYTALLRLPGDMSRHEKAAQAQAVLAQLGLASCRDSIVGGPLVRGVSGGERKRVSIGQEMLTNPSLIFLDEPTSGLDSTTAGRIVSTLWELANGGRTVVMTIHQPSSRLFYMFHKILLMSEGSPIYFGRGEEAVGYFAGIGHPLSLAMNPSDFLLDLANGIPVVESSEMNGSELQQALVSAYEGNVKPRLKEELKQVNDKGGEGESESETKRWSTPWWLQFRVLLERDLKERRHEAFSPLQVIQVGFTAIVSGILWLQSGGHVPDQVGLLFFSTSFWGFFPLFNAIFTFPDERAMLAKERSSGMYRLSSYFAARMVGDLPMDLVLPTVFIIIVYWMGHLKRAAANFFMTLAVFLLNVLVSSGLGLAIGALVLDVKTATTVAAVTMLTFMLVGGYYVQKVPVFIAWIKYLSLSFYTFKLTLLTQFSPEEKYGCGVGKLCSVGDLPTVEVVGLGNKWLAIGMLFVMVLFYRFLAYLGLMRIGVIGH